MGVGGGFWDLLKPIAQYENLEYLRGKRAAVDLSFWIVQQETALKGNARKPHLRLTFFRTINLFAKLGVFPVFVVDGNPPALKSTTRMGRFYRMSGINFSPDQKEESSIVARNPVFNRYIEECVELLELMGMPVLRAKGEAEALCAQLNSEGWVDACITTDSDALLHGAKCVIKCLQVDCKEPIIECYRASNIDKALRLKRSHLIALALLVGCDYDSQGVPGIGLNTAVRIVHLFKEEEILDKLRELGKGNASLLSEMDNSGLCQLESEDDADTPVKKVRHCSHCGHPGNKVNHNKLGCEVCKAIDSEAKCVRKPQGWKCECASCLQEKRRKEHAKCLYWKTKILAKICATNGFPNEKIVNMFLGHDTSALGDLQDSVKSLSWKAPHMEFLEDFLGRHLYWDRSYTRQKLLPLCSVLLLREMATSKAGLSALHNRWLLYDRYTPHSIERVKIHYSQSFYVLRWGYVNSKSTNDDWLGLKSKVFQKQKRKASEVCEFQGEFDEDVNAITVERVKGCLFITTDEDMELVKSACPELVENFEHEKSVKKSNRAILNKNRGRKSSTRKQRSITSYFKATKGLAGKAGELLPITEDKQDGNTNENCAFPLVLETRTESLSTPLSTLNNGGIPEMDPVSKVETNKYLSSLSGLTEEDTNIIYIQSPDEMKPASQVESNKYPSFSPSSNGVVEIINIESPDQMNIMNTTRELRRCLF